MPTRAPTAVRHVALLRGINVGRAKRVAMADLRDVLSELGYRDVRTLLNSGNAVFDGPMEPPTHHAARIQRAIEQRLGVSSRVTVVAAGDFAAIVEANVLRDRSADPSRLLVAFTDDAAALRKLEPVARDDWSPEALALGPGAAYMRCAQGILDSKVLSAVSGVLGDRMTTRNWATVEKIHALLRESR